MIEIRDFILGYISSNREDIVTCYLESFTYGELEELSSELDLTVDEYEEYIREKFDNEINYITNLVHMMDEDPLQR